MISAMSTSLSLALSACLLHGAEGTEFLCHVDFPLVSGLCIPPVLPVRTFMGSRAKF